MSLPDPLSHPDPRQPRRSRPRARGLAAGLLLMLSAWQAAAQTTPLEQAQERLDAGDPEAALALIEKGMGRGKARGQALLLRSTARFMLGEREAATADLRQALAADPSLRQGWLNLAAVEMSVERWDAAYQALREAEKLDPDAEDNDLNLGAVQLLRGAREAAQAHFSRYLSAHADDAEAFYQVAVNYGLADDPATAIAHLERAVVLDERIRLRIRGDARFDYYQSATVGRRFNHLLNTDVYQPPPDARTAAATFSARYDAGERLLLDAVLAALRELRIPHEPTIEAAESWALIWGRMRIKVGNQRDGGGVVSVSAARDAFSAAAFHRRTQRLFQAVDQQLVVLGLRH